MKCQNCGRPVRDENAVISTSGHLSRDGLSWVERAAYGPTCARNLGIVAQKKPRRTRHIVMPYTRYQKPDESTPDLFEGVV